MFERFTQDARRVVVLAQEESRALRHDHIGTEHLLLGLLGAGGAAATALTEVGLTPEFARAEIGRRLACDWRLADQDADALRAIGIDLDAVRAKVEESFGPGALERTGGREGRHRGRGAGHVPFTPRAKKVLELSLREALRLKHNWIGPEHVLLGLLREGQGLAMEVVTVHGVSSDALRQRVLAVIGTAA